MSSWWLLIPAAVLLFIVLDPWPHTTGAVAEDPRPHGISACADRASIIHLSPVTTEAETIEFPLGVDGWDADAILACVAEIEAL